MATKAKNQAAQLEQYYEQIMLRTQAELTCIFVNDQEGKETNILFNYTLNTFCF